VFAVAVPREPAPSTRKSLPPAHYIKSSISLEQLCFHIGVTFAASVHCLIGITMTVQDEDPHFAIDHPSMWSCCCSTLTGQVGASHLAWSENAW